MRYNRKREKKWRKEMERNKHEEKKERERPSQNHAWNADIVVESTSIAANRVVAGRW